MIFARASAVYAIAAAFIGAMTGEMFRNGQGILGSIFVIATGTSLVLSYLAARAAYEAGYDCD